MEEKEGIRETRLLRGDEQQLVHCFLWKLGVKCSLLES